MELDPKYVDVAVRRWEQWSGVEAVHAETGLTFAEMAAQREEEQASSLAKSSEAQPGEIDAGHGPSRALAPPMRIRNRMRAPQAA